MKRWLRCSLLLLCLASCSYEPEVESEVTRTHAPSFVWRGRSFAFEGTASSSSRRAAYQSTIAKQLIALGMRPALTPTQADLAVRFRTSTGKPTTTVYEYDDGMDDFTGGGIPGWNNSGWGWGMVGGWDTETVTTYPHRLKVEMLDLNAPNRPVVFNGKLLYEGEEKSFAHVANCLINAMFTEFPGEDGKTVTVALPAKGCIESKDASKSDLHVQKDGHSAPATAGSGS